MYINSHGDGQARLEMQILLCGGIVIATQPKEAIRTSLICASVELPPTNLSSRSSASGFSHPMLHMKR